jgi:hypothetical protein
MFNERQIGIVYFFDEKLGWIFKNQREPYRAIRPDNGIEMKFFNHSLLWKSVS